MAFQNRVAQYLNRKKLTVVSQSTNASGKTVLTVDVEREEGNVYVGGSALTAEELNQEIRQIVVEKLGTTQGATGVTQCSCDYSEKIATTKFVWEVLTALGLTKINHNHNSGGGSSGSGSSGSGSGGS